MARLYPAVERFLSTHFVLYTYISTSGGISYTPHKEQY